MATLTFKPTPKDRLFYDKYEYGLAFKLYRSGLLRGADHKILNNRIKYNNSQSGYWAFRNIDDKEAKNLHDCLDMLDKIGPHKRVLTSDYVYVYSNSTEDLESIVNLDFIQHPQASQAVVNRPRDTLLLVDPKYKYRTYFKERFMKKEEMAVLSKFLLNREDCFRITGELERKLKKNYHFYTQSYYFVDHNNMQDLIMLQMVCPGIVRKTLTIQAK